MRFNEYLELHPRQRDLPNNWARSNYQKYLKKHRLEDPEPLPIRWGGHGDQTKPHHLYRLYRDNELVYIGYSSNPSKRFKAHRRQGTKDFDEMRVFASYDSKAAALLGEYIQIMKYKPEFNIAYLNGSQCPVKIVGWQRNTKKVDD